MKKVVNGLVGIALSFAVTGCMVYEADSEVNKIRNYNRELRKIIGVESHESYSILEPNQIGDSFKVFIVGANRNRMIEYRDLDKDGEYEVRINREIKLPDKLDIKILPKPNLDNVVPKILPEEEKKSKGWVYLK